MGVGGGGGGGASEPRCFGEECLVKYHKCFTFAAPILWNNTHRVTYQAFSGLLTYDFAYFQKLSYITSGLQVGGGKNFLGLNLSSGEGLHLVSPP